ncbi:MAG: S8 family serine peptidase [Anaerolineae bacterium]|nr:S8 family serine peptidase [Anaerolineae bacterium]
MIEKEQEVEPIPRRAENAAGCGRLILSGATFIWILALSVFSLAVQWSVEQMIFEGSLHVPDFRWLISAGYGAALISPFLILSAAVKTPRQKVVYRALFLASVFAFLQFPTRFLKVTATQGVMAVQIGLMLVFLGGTWAASRRFKRKRQLDKILWTLRSWEMSGTAAVLLAVPWVLWGALGSMLDTGLALATGLLLGYCFHHILQLAQFSAEDEFEAGKGLKGCIRDGVFFLLVLLILSTAIAQNCNQWILPVLVSVAGMGLSFLSYSSTTRNGKLNDVAAVICPGLAAAWPLMWVDSDELNILVSLGKGEGWEWAARALLVSLAIMFATILLTLSVRKFVKREVMLSRRVYLLAGFIFLTGLAGIYWGLGTPGFYGERLFVVLRDQADVSDATQFSDPTERRAYVYNRLVVQAVESQRDLRRVLNRWGIAHRPYYLVNALEVRGGPFLRFWLETRPEVERVLDNPILRPLPEVAPPVQGHENAPSGLLWNLRMIRADEVWKMGITGKGIVVGQSDSGVQGDHPEVSDSYRGQYGDQDYNWLDPWNRSPIPVDIGGHGSHTLATILGNRVGVAPDATWIGCVNLARNLGNPAVYLECWQFLLAPYPQDGDPFYNGRVELGAHILNNSWGCPAIEGCDPEVYLPAVNALKAAGIFVVVSAGNSGYSGCGSVEDPPAIYSQVYSVGAVGQDGSVSAFSSLGPVTVDGSNRIKPDILAPGQDILSAYPGGTYEVASGTSMAGPHVAGVVALMWSANPDLIGDVERTTQILNRSAQPYSGYFPACATDSTMVPNNVAGYGVLDALSAVSLAMEER